MSAGLFWLGVALLCALAVLTIFAGLVVITAPIRDDNDD